MIESHNKIVFWISYHLYYWKVYNLNYIIAFLGLIADVSLYLQFVSFMLLKHSIVTVARSSQEKEREMVYFCLRNDSGRAQWNQYLYKVSINFFILICDFIKTLSSLHSETADVIWPPWNDQMLLLHKIIWHNLMKSFLMQHSYFHFQEIFMKYLYLVSRTTDAQRENRHHCTAENSLPLPNF